jgi:hypothetical protein
MPAITMEPTATTVAGEEPDTAAKSMQASTEAIARPPRRWPMHAMAKRIMRFATPPVVMKAPERMKNGIASSVKCSLVSKSLSASDGRESCPKKRIVSTDDRPSAIAIGMPISMNANSMTNRIAVVMCVRSPAPGPDCRPA